LSTATTQLEKPRRDSRLGLALDAAARRFRAQGFEGASMREIAGDAGMKAGSLYYHFESKTDLFIAVHDEGIRRISTAVETAIESVSDPWQRLENAMSAHLDVLLAGGDYARVVIRELPAGDPEMRENLVRLRDRYESTFRGLIDGLPVDGALSRHQLRMMVMGALNWTPTWYRPNGDTPAEIATGFLCLIRKGIDQT